MVLGRSLVLTSAKSSHILDWDRYGAQLGYILCLRKSAYGFVNWNIPHNNAYMRNLFSWHYNIVHLTINLSIKIVIMTAQRNGSTDIVRADKDRPWFRPRDDFSFNQLSRKDPAWRDGWLKIRKSYASWELRFWTRRAKVRKRELRWTWFFFCITKLSFSVKPFVISLMGSSRPSIQSSSFLGFTFVNTK